MASAGGDPPAQPAASPAEPAPLPSSYTPRDDFWSRPPASLLGYGHVVGEVLLPLFPQYTRYLSAVTMAYVGMSSVDRGNRASRLEPHPELRRYNGAMAGFESAFGGWVGLITLPSMALGFVTGPVAAAFQARAGSLPPAAVRYGPAGVTAALLPAVMAACSAGAGWAVDFAVRPAIESNRPPLLTGPKPDYEAPSPEELLGLGGGVAADLDPADRARLRWALDGDPNTPYPEEGAGGAGAAPRGAAEDAAFLASLADYASRVEAAKTRAGGAGGGGGAAVDSDYDRIVAAAVDAASGGRLTRAREAVTTGGGGAGAPGGGAPLK